MTVSKIEFLEKITDIELKVGRRITKEWDDSFGSMVLISVPRETSPTYGSVCGWMHPDDDVARVEVLLGSFRALCFALITNDEVNPVLLHELVMSAAVTAGVAVVIKVDEEDELGGMTKN